jgi:hypothetical protein
MAACPVRDFTARRPLPETWVGGTALRAEPWLGFGRVRPRVCALGEGSRETHGRDRHVRLLQGHGSYLQRVIGFGGREAL